MTEGLAGEIETRGFAVIPGHLDRQTLHDTREWHEASLAAADPAAVSLSASGSNTRVHLTRNHRGLDHLHLDPLLLALGAHVLGGPVRLGAFLSRTVHPGAAAQGLHSDCPGDGGRPGMLGFIYALDDFRVDNGATRFLPGSHSGLTQGACVPATAPAGSLIVYDGAVHHGFSANTSRDDRRSIEGSLVPVRP
ncbi:MAG TPA: phytanoyl-CoA dioxygenase family protein [Allosphingosinicella sp.]|nr:phytanoyl-CoA dioxygenase family protein [Allosphingosinicella sp.]